MTGRAQEEKEWLPRSRTDTLDCCIFETALGRPVELLVKLRGDIIRGSAVQQLGAVYANVRSGVEGRFAAIFLLRFAVVEGYCGHNSVLTGFRGVKIPFYSPTNPDFASTALTDGRAFGVRAANDTRMVVNAKQIGGRTKCYGMAGISFNLRTPLIVLEGNLTPDIRDWTFRFSMVFP
jgi:hypothetical protein